MAEKVRKAAEPETENHAKAKYLKNTVSAESEHAVRRWKGRVVTLDQSDPIRQDIECCNLLGGQLAR